MSSRGSLASSALQCAPFRLFQECLRSLVHAAAIVNAGEGGRPGSRDYRRIVRRILPRRGEAPCEDIVDLPFLGTSCGGEAYPCAATLESERCCKIDGDDERGRIHVVEVYRDCPDSKAPLRFGPVRSSRKECLALALSLPPSSVKLTSPMPPNGLSAFSINVFTWLEASKALVTNASSSNVGEYTMRATCSPSVRSGMSVVAPREYEWLALFG